MHVSDILKAKGTRVVSIQESEPITRALTLLHDNQIGALVVLDAQAKVVGLISERDIVRGLATEGSQILSGKVARLMTRRLYICSPTDDLRQVMSWMTNHRVRHLPVVQDGQLSGMVSIGDVVRNRLDEVQTEANVLRDIVLASR